MLRPRAAKLRDPRVTFQALLETVKALAEVMGVENPAPAPLVLYTLGAMAEPLAVSEVARAAGLDLKTTSRTIKALRKRGWVECHGDPADDRKRRVSFTPQGAAIMKLVNGAFVECAFRVVENCMETGPLRPASRKRTSQP